MALGLILFLTWTAIAVGAGLYLGRVFALAEDQAQRQQRLLEAQRRHPAGRDLAGGQR
jgi:Na+/H+-dicarboxylate symporter